MSKSVLHATNYSMSQRERVTITIRQDLLRRLDQTVDHDRIRNRSHALEVLLARALNAGINQAVILASGEGVKMRPFTYEIPKPLIPVHDQPIMEYTINLLRQHGITNIIITTSHLANKITKHFGDGSKFGVNITYAHEDAPSGTAGALRAARPFLSDDSFLALYGDVLADLDLTDFAAVHEDHEAAIGTIALTSVADPSTFGAVKLRGTRVVEFSEKPTISTDVSRLIFAGAAIFRSSVFDFFPQSSQNVSLENHIFPELINQGRLYGYLFEGQWFDVSTPETYELVLKHWHPASP